MNEIEKKSPYGTDGIGINAVKIESSKENSKEILLMKKNYPFFRTATAIYAIFYTYCLYKNVAGITAPFFVTGTLFYFYLCIKKLELSWKRDSWFYMVSIILIGISLCMTDDSRIILMNYIGLLILVISLMLHQFYQDGKWSFGKYWSVIGTIILDTIASVGFPVQHAKEYKKSYKNREEVVIKNSNLKNVAKGIGIAFPLAVIVLALLVSADSIFGDYFTEFMKEMIFHWDLFGSLILTVFIFFISYGFIGALAKKEVKEELERGKGEAVTAITFTSILSLIYLLFSGVQVMGLFMGQLQLPYGYTYAEYARQGFFQLLLVCIINIILVLICMALFKDNFILRIMLTVISGCTFIMIFSSAYRMYLYITVYQLTFLRIFVLWSLLVIFLLLTGIVISIFRNKFPLFKYSMVVVTVLYICLAFSRPDYLIAKENLTAINQMTEADNYTYADYCYLATLSADAAPIILNETNLNQMSNCDLEEVMEYRNKIKRKYNGMSIGSFNVSIYKAGKLLGLK